MLKIRLQRFGRKREPTFRVVLTESQSGPKSGKFLEVLGSHDPRGKGKEPTRLKKDRILHWISKGAQISDTVHNLLIRHGVIRGKKIDVSSKKKKKDTDKDEGGLKEGTKSIEEETSSKEKERVLEEKGTEAPTSEGVGIPTEDAKRQSVGKKKETEAPKEIVNDEKEKPTEVHKEAAGEDVKEKSAEKTENEGTEDVKKEDPPKT